MCMNHSFWFCPNCVTMHRFVALLEKAMYVWQRWTVSGPWLTNTASPALHLRSRWPLVSAKLLLRVLLRLIKAVKDRIISRIYRSFQVSHWNKIQASLLILVQWYFAEPLLTFDSFTSHLKKKEAIRCHDLCCFFQYKRGRLICC